MSTILYEYNNADAHIGLATASQLVAVTMAIHSVQEVDSFGELMSDLMERAAEVKHTSTIEPVLNRSEFADILERLEAGKWSFAAIDIVIRDRFNSILVSKLTQ